MRIYLRFLKNALRYKGRLIIGLIGIIGVNVFQVASLTALVPFVDNIINRKEIILPKSIYQTLGWVPFDVISYLEAWVEILNKTPPKILLFWLAIFVLGSYLLKNIFKYIMQVTMESVAQNVMRDFTVKMYSHLQILPVQYFAKMRTGELISRVTNDVNMVQASLSARFSNNLAEIVQLPSLLIVAIVLNWKMTLLAGIFLPLIMGPIAIIGRRLRKLAKKSQEKIADITSILQETISGVRIVRAFNMENYEIDRFKIQADKYCKLRVKSVIRASLVSPLTEIVGILCILVVAGFLIKPVLENKETAGPIMLYVGALLVSIKPFRSIGKVNNIIQKSLAAIVRIYNLLDTDPEIKEIPGAVDIDSLKKEIRFEHVSFSYEKDATPVVSNLNLTVRAGEMVAVVGPSGAGKTSLVNLIPRFYEVTEGSILFDGIDIRDLTFSSLRNQIGIVTQETFLFNDSVRNNIAYGRSDISMEQIEEATKAANAHDFILEMPEGYDTIIGERGVRLSGGQRQRLAIARAILKNPPVLIFDEATSALDTESERLVQQAIDRLVENRTVFAIAHRLSTIHHADKILVIDEGKVVQVGDHESLMADDDGLYKRLHNLQYDGNNKSDDMKIIDFVKQKIKHAKAKKK